MADSFLQTGDWEGCFSAQDSASEALNTFSYFCLQMIQLFPLSEINFWTFLLSGEAGGSEAKGAGLPIGCGEE